MNSHLVRLFFCVFKYTLQSATNNDMVVPRSRLKFGERAFGVAAPRAWNSLCVEMRRSTNTIIFEKKLKTFLFRQSHNLLD